MAAFDPTYLSRVSIGWVSSSQSVVDKNPGDTGVMFSVTGDAQFASPTRVSSTLTVTSNASIGGTLNVDGAQTNRSTITVAGTATFTAGLRSPSNVTLTSDLTVGGAATVDGAVRLNSTLTVLGAVTHTGALRQVGAARFISDVTVDNTFWATGDIAALGGLYIGSVNSASEIVEFSSGTAAVSFGAINPNESSSVQTVALSEATRGDHIWVTVDSLWPNVDANRDIAYFASSSSTAGEVHMWAINSTLTQVTPTASTVFRLVRINFPSYI